MGIRTCITPAGKQKHMPRNGQILQNLIRRLHASVSRSPILRATPSRTGRLIDCSRFKVVSPSVPRELIGKLLDGTGAVTANFSPQRDSRKDDRQELDLLYAILTKGIVRHAELAKRETGVHAMWFGYPLLFARVPGLEATQEILAPVFLWPISVAPDLRNEWRVRISRTSPDIRPRFNLPMAAWLRRQFMIEVDPLTEDELEDLDFAAVNRHVTRIAKQFDRRPDVALSDALVRVPSLKTLADDDSPAVFNAAVMGYMTWQNEALLADLESICSEADACQGPVAGFSFGEQLPEPRRAAPPPEQDRFVVCDADFSQTQVIWQSREAPGLVVHGPPGTGKSQTIVNIIADTLGHGRTVLMVCQKRAATQVVLERLRAVQLDALCIEVHDVDADRLSTFRAIRSQVDALDEGPPGGVTSHRSSLSEQITSIEDELDQHASALHSLHSEIGLSYPRICSGQARVMRQFPTVRELRAVSAACLHLSSQKIQNVCERVSTMGKLFRQADPLHNPWRHRIADIRLTPGLLVDVKETAAHLHALNRLHQQVIASTGIGLSLPANINGFAEDAQEVLAWCQRMVAEPSPSLKRVTKAWIRILRDADAQTIAQEEARCATVSSLAKDVGASQVVPEIRRYFEALSIEQLLFIRQQVAHFSAIRNKWWRFLSSRFWDGRTKVNNLRRQTGVVLTNDQIVSSLLGMIARRKLLQLNELLIPGLRAGDSSDEKQMRFASVCQAGIACATTWLVLERKAVWLRPFTDAYIAGETDDRLNVLMDTTESTLQRIPQVQLLMQGLKSVESFLNPLALDAPRDDILSGKDIGSWISAFATGVSGLRALTALDADREQRQGAIKTILDALEEYERLLGENKRAPQPPPDIKDDDYGSWWAALLEYSALCTWQRLLEAESPILTRLTPVEHDNKAKRLKELLAEKRKSEPPTILAKWRKEQSTLRTKPWNRIFQLRGSQNGPSKRLREAIELGLPEGLLTMRPCWLMNPSVAAQVFPLAQGLFDVVIFDEASQCPLEQAIPSIYRGKTLIVSGDEKQLPPTSFFSSRIESEEQAEDDEEAVQEVVRNDERRRARLGTEFMMQSEDLLTAAVGTLQEHWLRVHYRSEHPDLINFSNHAFYAGRLEAPPVARKPSFQPIIYHHLDEAYENRTNEGEAKKVIDLLGTFWSSGKPSPSIGVVTFNQPQRGLIQDLILKRCQQDARFAARFQQEMERRDDRNQDASFFVKNLENVQGDERDIMIFSTTFGKDTDGRFYRRFGPVGARGGERRLNVAVTRAKKQIIVVGSMPIPEVSTALYAGDNAPGAGFTPAGYLQLYLAYAQSVSASNGETTTGILQRFHSQGTNVQPVGDTESPFEEDVLEAIQRMGYTAHAQVGDGGFRIDLAIQHPNPERGYVLGIECDGATYHSDRSARIRDVWREQILRSRGWALHRIWSTEWWYNQAEELDALNGAIREAIALHL